MRNLIIPVCLGLLCSSFTIIPALKTTTGNIQPVGTPAADNDSCAADEAAPFSMYDNMGLELIGLSRQAFENAWKGYQYLLAQHKVRKEQYLTICDFSQPSSKKRLYIIDVENNKVLFNTYVAHGRNSGAEFATKFSNTPESLQSSLGFYITDATYIGEHGLSLRVKGLEPGFNDKAYERSIVIHGAEYVDAARARAGVFMGRSFGCPAVPQKESQSIINTIRDGSCLFIFHPTTEYLHKSKILNG